ncbi:ATP-binding protein [Thermoactinomyces sp. DSM 45892]|uniref:ATP-binding protein n=1 Tax=Thermoactinomyces sp. DSM 45892 TaxID=1882753 RepID=UPI00089B328F|nr:ATP-binding protein [Thermoactinomyces sp. DSM 45892]SDZ23503.1 Predicted kinase [Thermoactinomyces sp. DSM 45892]
MGKTTKLLVVFTFILSLIVTGVLSVSAFSHPATKKAGEIQKEAIFMVGPPAAGKSSTRKKLYPNYRVIDPDELKAKAWVMLQEQYKQNPEATVDVLGEKHKLSDYANLLEKNYDESNTDMVELAHPLSKELSTQEFQDVLTKNDSFVYDTTGGNVERMKREIQEAKQKGFKIVLLYVYAPLDVCLKRNAERSRHVPEDVVKEIWNDVQKAWVELKDLPIVDMTKMVDTSIK